MSNYIRSLLRFEKSRASTDGGLHDDDPSREPRRPLSEREARKRDEEAVREFFEEAPRLDDPPEHTSRTALDEPGAMETGDSGFPLLEDVDFPGHRRRSLWSRLPFFRRRNKRRASFESASKETFFSDRNADANSSYGRLLDSLRAVDTGFPAPGVVLASASTRRSVRAVIDGLAHQARSMGVRLAVAELVFAESERVLRSRDDSSTTLPTTESLELTGSGSDQILQDWFERATAGVDLLVIEGPPLARSVDAALMARAGDGLVIVAEPQSTLLEEFETAIERAKASGCLVLGMVLNRHTHWLPRFLRGFFYRYPRSIRNRNSPSPRSDRR